MTDCSAKVKMGSGSGVTAAIEGLRTSGDKAAGGDSGRGRENRAKEVRVQPRPRGTAETRSVLRLSAGTPAAGTETRP